MDSSEMTTTDATPAPIVVTATGPAAARAEREVLPRLATEHQQEIRFVDTRSSVVLFIVDGVLEPTRAELATITAISQATGRVAVGLYVDRAPVEGEVTPGAQKIVADAWRAAIPAQIPVGGLDTKMVRTLTLLHSGPANSISPSFAQQRRAHLAEMLMQQREFSAQQVSTIHQRQRRQTGAAVTQAISELVDDAARAGITRDVLMKPEQRVNRLYRVSSRAAGRVADAVWESVGQSPQSLSDTVSESFPVTEPRSVPPRFSSAEIVMSIFMLGAAASVGRLLSVPLEWRAVPGLLTQTIGVCVGLLLATAASALTIRRKAHATLRQWFVEYLAQLRAAWESEVAIVLAEHSGSVPNWRLTQLNDHLRGG